MVLYKRKPVQLLPPPTNLPDNAEIFVMKHTNEIFTDYEKYVKRLDFLSQKKFVDAVNGASNLTFFKALESETQSSNAIENVFPESLRAPILRKVQFSTTARISDLVTEVFEEFKHDYFPGEEIVVNFENGDKMPATVSEKVHFPTIRGPYGDVEREAFSRYFVRLHNRKKFDAIVDDKWIRRDRKVFTKLNLRAFLKHSLQRETWTGAPWLVKEQLAIQYRLPMEIPPHLLHDAKLLANKQQILQSKQIPRRRPKNMSPEEFKKWQELHPPIPQTDGMNQPGVFPPRLPQVKHTVPKPPPPPPIKYPIEDLEISPRRDGVKRPKLEFFTAEMADHVTKKDSKPYKGIKMQSMGMLLEVWNTLNVQCEVYVLDSFTFDDFVAAMNYKSTEIPCELFEEVHCAVLKVIVDDKANVMLTKGALPEMVEEDESESEEEVDNSEMSTPLPDVPARSTRSRLSQVETVDTSTAPEKVHRVPEMLGDRDWITRLGARDFEDGGWQVVLAGLLYNLSLSPVYKTRCDEVLAELAPVWAAPTRETARVQYAEMSINLRISALQMIAMLSIATPAIKDFLETCSDDMTDVRKRKIEYQKAKKAAIEELHVKDRERKILLPENMAPESPKQESAEPVSFNGDATEESIEVNGASASDPDDEAPTKGRSLRRGNDRKRKREEEAARAAEEKARKAEAAKKENKQTREFKKLVAEIEQLKGQIMDNESKITECDADLREANVQRTKVLGKDRFCNRYYWFERNGQPFGGLPSSSTAGCGYANGRIWVQGPDKMELDGFVGRTPDEKAEQARRFKMSFAERRRLEEGDTVLRDAHDWGCYLDPDALDGLIGWLDERGEREKRLRKELTDWRDLIAQYMHARASFDDQQAAKRAEADEELLTRVSTRHKEREDQAAAHRHRCLRWTNSMALEQNGHLHSRAAERPRARQKQLNPPRHLRGVAIPINKYGKRLTRQG